MSDQLALLEDCPVAACCNPVAGTDPCDECLRLFGPFLKREGERSAWVPPDYVWRTDGPRPAWVAPDLVLGTDILGRPRWVKP